MPKADVDQWQKLEARAKKLEAALRAPRVRKPSHVYHLVAAAAPDEMSCSCSITRRRSPCRSGCATTSRSTSHRSGDHAGRMGHHRSQAGTPKYAKARDEFISEILDRRPKKSVEEELRLPCRRRRNP